MAFQDTDSDPSDEIVERYTSSLQPEPLNEVPQIPLPISDEARLHDDLKNLLRAMLINQNNLMSNTEWLHKQIEELKTKVGGLQGDLNGLQGEAGN